MKHILFLSNEAKAPSLTSLAEKHGLSSSVVFTKTELTASASNIQDADNNTYLLSFATGVIVPSSVLEKFEGRAFNVHPASPEYPGRDPHHFAAYDAVSEYGATTHIMTDKVDAGDILYVSTESTSETLKPNELMVIAEQHGETCIDYLLQQIAQDAPLEPQNISWGERKTTRLDFQSFCRISPLDSPEETERRLHAVNVDGYKNAYVDLNGHRFKYEGPTPVTGVHRRDEKRWGQFTEKEYRQLLRDTKERYEFATYTSGREGKHVLWRHDMDHSIHQAYELAKIEHEEGVVATYMFTLRLPNYNILEYDTQCIAREILKLGHKAGLHFDVAVYEKEDWTTEELEETMAKERDLLAQTLDAPVEAMSYHDPDCGDLTRFDNDIMAGMVNCYSQSLRENYEYCSDSNGYWRHRPIPDVIKSGEFERIHVLTHPEWWTRDAMPPRQRIEYSQLWHAQDIMKIYDNHLAGAGRKNIR